MIAASAGVKVMVATRPVDFRRGADGLAALVREQLRHDPFSGTIFVFRSKRADRLKFLVWDGSGRSRPLKHAVSKFESQTY
jgi:transposase